MTITEQAWRLSHGYQEAIIDAAIAITVAEGWSAVTMGRIADDVGVSRQTVYNEVNSKAGLAEAMVMHELNRYLAVVDAAFDDNPESLVGAIHDAVIAVLRLAEGNGLLRKVVSAEYGAETELLPFLTTDAGSIFAAADAALARRAAEFDVPLDEHQVHVVIDMVVRLTLSHIMRPADSLDRVAQDVTWMVDSILASTAHH